MVHVLSKHMNLYVVFSLNELQHLLHVGELAKGFIHNYIWGMADTLPTGEQQQHLPSCVQLRDMYDEYKAHYNNKEPLVQYDWFCKLFRQEFPNVKISKVCIQ